MRIISTNIAKPRTITWRGQQVKTGIYKLPTEQPIQLDIENVKGDEVSDRRVHGGIYKACYLYATDDYSYWKERYPNLEWTWGMFGENLSVEDLDETKIYVGDTYQLGTAVVQITQPRQPCFKLGIKFGDMSILKQFIKHGRSGVYVKIIKEGFVAKNDTMTLIKSSHEELSIAQLFKLLYSKDKDQILLQKAVHNEALPIRLRTDLLNFVTN